MVALAVVASRTSPFAICPHCTWICYLPYHHDSTQCTYVYSWHCFDGSCVADYMRHSQCLVEGVDTYGRNGRSCRSANRIQHVVLFQPCFLVVYSSNIVGNAWDCTYHTSTAYARTGFRGFFNRVRLCFGIRDDKLVLMKRNYHLKI